MADESGMKVARLSSALRYSKRLLANGILLTPAHPVRKRNPIPPLPAVDASSSHDPALEVIPGELKPSD